VQDHGAPDKGLGTYQLDGNNQKQRRAARAISDGDAPWCVAILSNLPPTLPRVIRTLGGKSMPSTQIKGMPVTLMSPSHFLL